MMQDAIHGFQVLREQGNQAFKENNLEMAKFFYCTAMGAIQENLRHQAMSDSFDQILDEACKCTCNLSLVYLKEKNYKEALHSAEKCCQMQPNYAKVQDLTYVLTTLININSLYYHLITLNTFNLTISAYVLHHVMLHIYAG